MEKFEEGDIVYHKATEKRGVIKEKRSEGDWLIVWEDGNPGVHAEVELYTEEEYKKKSQGPGIN